MEKHAANIVEWLRSQVKTAGVKGLLVGVSGGLDSAVIAHLIKRAFPDESLGVIMPLKSSERDLEDANRVVNDCGIEHLTVDLSDTHHTLLSEIQSHIHVQKKEGSPLIDANLRARLRMSTLYAIAAEHEYLVVGTDNAAEWYTGYFTKYGDGGVDLQPLVTYTKKEVRELAAYFGVARNVIDKKPSADLWEGQTDEKEMGVSYDTIDAYLEKEPIAEADETRIKDMHRKTEHKRNIPTRYKREHE